MGFGARCSEIEEKVAILMDMMYFEKVSGYIIL
jgi:hypothetical protein